VVEALGIEDSPAGGMGWSEVRGTAAPVGEPFRPACPWGERKRGNQIPSCRRLDFDKAGFAKVLRAGAADYYPGCFGQDFAIDP
jgi:hypothetical protein